MRLDKVPLRINLANKTCYHHGCPYTIIYGGISMVRLDSHKIQFNKLLFTINIKSLIKKEPHGFN